MRSQSACLGAGQLRARSKAISQIWVLWGKAVALLRYHASPSDSGIPDAARAASGPGESKTIPHGHRDHEKKSSLPQPTKSVSQMMTADTHER
jgi:hypothetical protein